MESHSTGWILVLIVLLLLSAFFSASETAFSSLNRIRLKNRANGGDRRAKATLELAQRYDKLLSTILIGNNLVNIASTSIATVLFVAYWGDVGVTLSTAVMTVAVLIFGEITPKCLAKRNADRLAMAVTPPLRVLMAVLTPVSGLFALWTKLLDRLRRHKEEPTVSGEELITLVDEAESEGAIDETESELIRAAVAFDDRDAADILTPRIQVEAVSLTDTPEEICRVFEESGFSRLPVYQESVDHIVGILHEKDFYRAYRTGSVSLSDIMGEAVCVPPGCPLSGVMRELKEANSHMAVVIDEFGGTLGIVTLEDVLEELVGEIWDEHDEVVVPLQPQEDGSFLVDCDLRMDELFEQLACEWPCEATTVGGWVMEQLGRIPHTGDRFEDHGYAVTVTKEGTRCAEEVRLHPLQPSQPLPPITPPPPPPEAET